MTEKPLPEQIPIFPLTGAILLPRCHLPLNIFEPRYREMVEFAADNHGIIGMVQPLRSSISLSPENNDQFGTASRGRELYSVGCAGILSEVRETVPGQYFIILTGIRRFQIRSEIPLRYNFREVLADYEPFRKDGNDILKNETAAKERFLDTLKEYLDALNMKINMKIIANICDEELVNSISMILPFEASEKQLILETDSLDQRAELAIQIMTINKKTFNSGQGPNIH
jgi:Lon protease-like protein